jgi:methionine-gamma-lyase
MSNNSKYQTGSQTNAIHAGEAPDRNTGASTPNIVMSSTYVVDEPISFSVNNMNEDTPYIYSRWSNPTNRQLEAKLCVLENAEQCLTFASGMAASSGILFSQLQSGDHIVISNTNYPGTAEIARDLLPKNGIEVTPVDTTDFSKIEMAIQSNTKIIWVETPSNPLLRITDIEAAADLAHKNNAILVVDSTFASPVATRPLALGADLVLHSLTKYIGGHGDALGGAVLGSRNLISKLRGSGVMHYGGTLSPFNAWLIMRGTATLPLRMRCHQENALAVAKYLESHPSVEMVRYPGLESHPQHNLACRQMDNFSGMISFRVKQPDKTARKMMTNLEIIHYAVSLGHHRSLIYLMETDDLIKNSFKLDSNELEKYRDIAGDGIFRLSIGLEDHPDLVHDLDGVL